MVNTGIYRDGKYSKIREVGKNLGYVLGFQHSPRDLANVNEWQIIFDPYSVHDYQ